MHKPEPAPPNPAADFPTTTDRTDIAQLLANLQPVEATMVIKKRSGWSLAYSKAWMEGFINGQIEARFSSKKRDSHDPSKDQDRTDSK